MKATLPETQWHILPVGIVQRIAVAGVLTACIGWAQATAAAPGAGIRPASADAPEIASALGAGDAGIARRYMAVTAHPLASEVAGGVLERGGTVIDAAVAAQMVLNVVEPQSSGIGGGAFLLHYDAASGQVRAYDGRETAPAAADSDYLRYVDDAVPPRPVVPNPRQSGRAVGVPGTLRVLELVHQAHGRLLWAELFEPAIALARDGYVVGERMAASVVDAAPALARDPQAAALLLTAEGEAPAAGTMLHNPELAQVMARVAHEGAEAFYAGAVAADIIAKVARPPGGATPGRMSRSDLADYRALERDPVCAPYRRWEICGFPPPSSGGIAVAQMLGMLEHTPIADLPPQSREDGALRLDPQAVHWFAEAGRLAYADRDRYVADTDFVPLPGGGWHSLLDSAYLAARAALIVPNRSMGMAAPGEFSAVAAGADPGLGQIETTHLSLVDRYGNALAMTASVEGAFGSFMVVRGFFLNNELTDFAVRPADEHGRPVANRVEGGKRPRSSMAPTLVFERTDDGRRGPLALVTGSPGGGAIIQYVARNIVAMLDWGLDPWTAAAMNNFGAVNAPQTVLEANHPQTTPALIDALRAMGHDVVLRPRSSGAANIHARRDAGGTLLEGAADPRREGTVGGDRP